MELTLNLSLTAILVSLLGILVTMLPSPSRIVVLAHDPSYVGNKRRYVVSGTNDAVSAINAVRELSKKRIVGYSVEVAPINFNFEPELALENYNIIVRGSVIMRGVA